MEADTEELRVILGSLVGMDDANDPRWNEILFDRIELYQKESHNSNIYSLNRMRPLEKELMMALIHSIQPPFSENVKRQINKLFMQLGYADYTEDSRRPRNAWEYMRRRGSNGLLSSSGSSSDASLLH